MFTGSGQMSLRQFLIPTEVAHDAVTELGELKNVQLKDVCTLLSTVVMLLNDTTVEPYCQSLSMFLSVLYMTRPH
jgi:hypothetical protein